MHHTCRASARSNTTTICICASGVSALVGGTKTPPGQVTLGQESRPKIFAWRSPLQVAAGDHHHSAQVAAGDHHHTAQVARVKGEYLSQWLEGKGPPAQVAAGDHHYVCKWSICANWWKEKHQRIVALVQVGVGCTNNTQLQPQPPPTTDQITTTTCAIGVTDAVYNVYSRDNQRLHITSIYV